MIEELTALEASLVLMLQEWIALLPAVINHTV